VLTAYTFNFGNYLRAQIVKGRHIGLEEYSQNKWQQLFTDIKKTECDLADLDSWDSNEATPAQKSNYAKLKDLVHSIGVASERRSEIWKHFLKSNQLEKELVKVNPGITTIYESLLREVERVDCLTFSQIDEDIEAYKFPDNYLAHQSAEERAKQLLL
jgi:hypothetical protein